MDDWVVLVPTRWKLRAAIRALNLVMAALRVRQHLDKTILGRIAREFEFLGYRCSAARRRGGAADRGAVGTVGAGRTCGDEGGVGQGIMCRYV